MYGLRIKDPTYWCDSWSAAIGQTLEILNSTYNLFVFGDRTRREEILKVVEEIPSEAYELIRIHPSQSGRCEIFTDGGECYEMD